MLHEFAYHRPASLEEALGFLKEKGSAATVFAGGTDLFVNIRAGVAKPGTVVDLKGIPALRTLSWDDREGLSIGACVTVNELLQHPETSRYYPVLHAAGEELATYQLRNRATVVGNIVTASPCGDFGSPLLTLSGEVVLLSADGERRVPLRDFITGVKKTIIKPEEIVARVIVPVTWAGAAGGYEKLKRIKGHDLGVVSVAMIRHNGAIRCAVSSAAPTPVLLPDMPASSPVKEVQDKAQEMISPIDDVRCTREYRAFMVNVFIERLMKHLESARQEASA
ncbi:MAG: molybdopterin dehydrogenase [Spirochaetaceae bacterium]|nr:MAG: molybdopterin dehydrogenase [Spirochaetaceae bacterium]